MRSDTAPNTEAAYATSPAHHIKGLRPALQMMHTLGFASEDCLEGTGIGLRQIEEGEPAISSEQEFAFYRRLLTLSKDPTLGLKLGSAFRLESYGVFGYAILSAQTLGEALTTACRYAALSFSHFRMSIDTSGPLAHFRLHRASSIPNDLMAIYEDRDCAAILSGAAHAVGSAVALSSVQLTHSLASENQPAYETFFRAPVFFEAGVTQLSFDARLLSQKMPLRDQVTEQNCLKQCEELLRVYSSAKSLSAQVRQLMHDNLVSLHSIKSMSACMGVPERSLRRALANDGLSFSQLLLEERQKRALLLLRTNMGIESIAEQLGYSEAANFSHAFKRWYGLSPKQFRESDAGMR